ncbi:MAG TPA: hypothetical protein VGJ23_03870, partial [Gaiellaceae bacterium]
MTFEHEDRLAEEARAAEIKRAINTFSAACSEFNRVQDNFKGVMSDHSDATQRLRALREQEFDTLYEGAQAWHKISVEMTALHRSFTG